MSSIQTSATPINGKEAAETIKNQVLHLIENTPGLDVATSYHRFSVKGSFQIGAYPDDVPLPFKEIEFDINSISTTRKENEELFEYVKRLETVREELLNRLEEADKLLDIYNPVTRVEFNLNTIRDGEDKPDALRIEQGLPIPVVVKAGGRSVEVYKQASPKPGGGFQFGSGRIKRSG